LDSTINYLVDQKLKELADGLKKFTEGAEKKEVGIQRFRVWGSRLLMRERMGANYIGNEGKEEARTWLRRKRRLKSKGDSGPRWCS
jgi:hypothetical protein